MARPCRQGQSRPDLTSEGMLLLDWTLSVLRYVYHSRVFLDSSERLSQRARKSNVDPNVRHSFNGSEVQLDFSSTPTATNQSQFAMSPADVQPARASRMNGHVRSGSAGNWASATRSNTASHLTAYPLSSIPGGELKNNLPWADFSISRRTEANWP